MGYALRAASSADEAWLESLRRAAYQDLFRATWGGWDEARHARHFAESWRQGHICLVEIEGVPVGMIQLFEGPRSVEVGEIQILPRYQNRGIGREVLQDVIDAAHGSGKSVVLSVGLQNEGAHRLYRLLGFQDTGRSDSHFHMSCPPRK